MNNQNILKIKYIENEEIKNLTTYKTIGTISGAFYPQTEEELKITYNFLILNKLPFVIIGNGSNLLIKDKAKVFALVTKNMKQANKIAKNNAYLSSSCPLSKAYAMTMAHSLSGFEGLAGIPATVGGAIKMNASAFNQSIFEHLEYVKVLKAGNILKLNKNEIIHSHHYTNLNDCLILSAKFKLEERNKNSIKKDFITNMQKRACKQPKGFSCGSVFKNPPNAYAGQLIEICGLKGMSHGDAEISSAHANFILNKGSASFEDVKFLIELCQSKVYQKFGIKLEKEVEIIEF